MFLNLKKRNYNKSNKVTCIHFDISKEALRLSRSILLSKETDHRQELCLDLCDELCDLAGIDICDITISDKKQTHRKKQGRTVYKLYGFYKPDARKIHINNRTAVQGKILAAKTFLNTVLHEWMHHYDSCKLGLNSIHTTGFYLRLKSLEDQLRK